MGKDEDESMRRDEKRKKAKGFASSTNHTSFVASKCFAPTRVLSSVVKEEERIT